MEIEMFFCRYDNDGNFEFDAAGDELVTIAKIQLIGYNCKKINELVTYIQCQKFCEFVRITKIK
jgi:hypothetical protein